MPYSCFVPGCKTGYKSTRKINKLIGKTNPSIFKAPSDPETFDLWVINVPYALRPFGRQDGICEYHFTEDCIDRYHRTSGAEADRQCRLRRRQGLKKGAVPTIFTDTPSTEYDLKRKIPGRSSVKGSVAESSLCDSSAATSATDESVTDPYTFVDDADPQPPLLYANKPTRRYNTISEQSTSGDESTPDVLYPETEVVKPPCDPKSKAINEKPKLFPIKAPHDPKFECVDKCIKPSDDHVPSLSHMDIAELSPPESSHSKDGISEPLPSENEMDDPSIQNKDEYAKILGTSSAVWSLADLYNYAGSSQSLKDDNFTCGQLQSAVILQQWHSSSYHCIKMIILEENLQPQVFIENERYCSEELLRLNEISSETKLLSLIALVKELKVLPKISDFHLKSFYKKVVQQN